MPEESGIISEPWTARFSGQSAGDPRLTWAVTSAKVPSRHPPGCQIGYQARARLGPPPVQPAANQHAIPAPDTIAPAAGHYGFVPSLESRNHHMADEDLKAELARLKAENERLKSQRGRSVSLKVSEKGGVSVYGLGRFPVTLYKEQWTKLLAMTDEIRAFIKEHDAELKAKPET